MFGKDKNSWGLLFCLCILLVVGLTINGCGEEKPSVNTQANSQADGMVDGQANSRTDAQVNGQTNGQEPEDASAKAPDPAEAARTAKLIKEQGVPILYYHSVLREEGNELRMPPEQFAEQMTYLKEEGYESVSLNQLYTAAYQGGILPEKPFVITFDDGYEDNYTNAYPIIKENGFTATVFMVTSYIDGKGYLSWAQLQELVANGWEIESHTVNHPYLTQIDSAILLKELKNSKEQLERELGKKVNFIAYPYGAVNGNVVSALQDAEYLMAVTTERGWAGGKDDAWSLRRIYCYADMGLDEFARRMQNPNY